LASCSSSLIWSTCGQHEQGLPPRALLVLAQGLQQVATGRIQFALLGRMHEQAHIGLQPGGFLGVTVILQGDVGIQSRCIQPAQFGVMVLGGVTVSRRSATAKTSRPSAR
jgi:hypothetical protein